MVKRRGRPPGSKTGTGKKALLKKQQLSTPKKQKKQLDEESMTPYEKRIKKSHKKAKRDVNEPIKPANGYVLYLTRNRPRVKLANPGKDFPECTKLLAEEWNALEENGKKPWMEEAAANKAKWIKDLEAYHQSDAYKQFQKSLKAEEVLKRAKLNKKEKKIVKKKEPKSPSKAKSQSSQSTSSSQATSSSQTKSPAKTFTQFKSPAKPPAPKTAAKAATAARLKMPVVTNRGFMDYVIDNSPTGNGGEIPIFTEQFLDHNKSREMELRKLRKITTEYEEQNAILAKHIENMKAAEIKLRAEMIQMREKNQDVIDHLEKLKVQFVHQFANIPIPGTNEYPTLATVESYITRLHDKILEQKIKGNKENELIQEKLHQFVTLMAED